VNILAFSINPIITDRVTGGASKHLNRILRHLAEQGNQITLLCAAVAAQPSTFEHSPNILVKAVLPFHLPFPQPYAISPLELTRISRIIQSELEGKDRFYIHDGELLLPGVYSQVPTITSFRDNVYPESIIGTFIGQADEIICVSPYSADVIRYSAGSVLKSLNERIHIVLNGIDPEEFHPADPASIIEFLGLDSSSHRFLLHPHRPELSKGLKNTLDILEILVKRFGHKDLVLLSPNWLPEMTGELENLFKRDILAYIDRLGLTNHVIFHEWLKQDQLASYYSLGLLTFSVGSNPEAFGNVAYESLACGTPSVVARVGTHRTQLPDNLICKTEYDNPDVAALVCDNILRNSIRVTQSKRLNVLSILNIEKQLFWYADIILHANKRKQMQMTTHMIGGGNDYQLAPWCDLTSRGIFNDYSGKYLTELDCKGITELTILLKQSKRISPDKISQEKINQLVDLGVIVPNLI
jgi:glycosyltransferase involved in cell wall biosynthesis